MPAVLLLWNPKKWQLPEGDWERHVATLSGGGHVSMHWAVSRRRDLKVGTRGLATSEPWTDEHYAEPGVTASYVDVDWDAFVVAPDAPLPVETLLAKVPEVTWNFIREGGSAVDEAAVDKVETRWAAHPRAAVGS
jgi:hypothetical protein